VGFINRGIEPFYERTPLEFGHRHSSSLLRPDPAQSALDGRMMPRVYWYSNFARIRFGLTCSFASFCTRVYPKLR
jgi:hypothetical protein